MAVFPPSQRPQTLIAIHRQTQVQYINTQTRKDSLSTKDNKPTGANIAAKHKLISSPLKKKSYHCYHKKKKEFQTDCQQRRDQEMIDVMNERWILFLAGVMLMVFDFSLEQGHIMS